MVLRNEDGQLQYNEFEIAKSYDFNLYGFTFYGLAELRMDKSLCPSLLIALPLQHVLGPVLMVGRRG